MEVEYVHVYEYVYTWKSIHNTRIVCNANSKEYTLLKKHLTIINYVMVFKFDLQM